MTLYILDSSESIQTPVTECIQIEVIPSYDTFGENLEGWWTETVTHKGLLTETEWTESDASEDKGADYAFTYHLGIIPPIRRFSGLGYGIEVVK